MSITVTHIMLGFTVICASVAIWHEIFWYRKRSWKKAEGEVVDTVGVSDDERPVINYTHEGTTHSFTSIYSGSGCPSIGDITQVIYNPKTFQAEYFTLSNRWFFTIIPLFFAVVFAILSPNI